ncbi:MAG: M20/M25/M40 family metallo-hydrolase [Actinomycetia bacterium]|nr:M20/M25/M40 family metallo-hydrolase [Actinomycetes bacterium]
MAIDNWNADTADLIAAAKEQTPRAIDELRELVSYPSLAFEGYDLQPGFDCADEVLRLVREAGVANAEIIDIGGRLPLVWGEVPGPAGAPTVLLYAHYDVQPAPVEEQHWETDPFAMTLKSDGRWYGRGAADDKNGIVSHLAALRALGLRADGTAPLTLKVCFEGEEEYISALDGYVASRPDMFAADVYLISDSGGVAPGEPTIETSMRGTVALTVTVRTIRQALHSGLFGGATPDAMVAFMLMMANCYGENGATAIPGVEGADYPGVDYPADLLREQAGLLDGVDFAGAGSLSSRLWSRPSLSVIGLDKLPSVQGASNIVIPEVTALLSLRFPPGITGRAALDALEAHLRTHVPFGVQLEIEEIHDSNAFSFEPSPGFLDVARAAFETAFGAPLQIKASGGSIPLMNELQKIAPGADFLVFGSADAQASKIHGGNESVDPAELERVNVAETLFLQGLARG